MVIVTTLTIGWRQGYRTGAVIGCGKRPKYGPGKPFRFLTASNLTRTMNAHNVVEKSLLFKRVLAILNCQQDQELPAITHLKPKQIDLLVTLCARPRIQGCVGHWLWQVLVVRVDSCVLQTCDKTYACCRDPHNASDVTSQCYHWPTNENFGETRQGDCPGVTMVSEYHGEISDRSCTKFTTFLWW